jgi:hypothetical protein
LFRDGSGLTWRRLLTLTEGLPNESATKTSIRSDAPEEEIAKRASEIDTGALPWSSTDTLLAMLVNEIRNLSWQYAQSHSKSKIQRPEPIALPGSKSGRRNRPELSVDQIREMDPRMKDLDDDEVLRRYREITRRD